MEKTIANSDKIKLHYAAYFENGKEIESNFNEDPVEIVVGSTSLVTGIHEHLIGMKEGEEKEILLEPEKAFGKFYENLVVNLPKEKVPNANDLKPGKFISFRHPAKEGKSILAAVLEINDTHVVANLNHPLAGKKIKYRIKVEKIL